jgi:hypothetical protein
MYKISKYNNYKQLSVRLKSAAGIDNGNIYKSEYIYDILLRVNRLGTIKVKARANTQAKIKANRQTIKTNNNEINPQQPAQDWRGFAVPLGSSGVQNGELL